MLMRAKRVGTIRRCDIDRSLRCGSGSRESPPHNINNMAKIALITGATGLLGRQVVKAFTRAGWEVKGTGYTRASPPTILKVDLSSEAAVAKTLEDVK